MSTTGRDAVPPFDAAAKAKGEAEETETARCKCCTLEADSGLRAFLQVQGDQEGASQCALRWSMEVASILIFIAASIYLTLSLVQLPGKVSDILKPMTCLYKDGVVGSSFAQDDQEEICIELPQRVIDWAGWPDASLELADFSVGWDSVEFNSTGRTLKSGRKVRRVDPRQLRNDTFLALNFNTDRCNRGAELNALFLSLSSSVSASDVCTEGVECDPQKMFAPCQGCDQTCAKDGPKGDDSPLATHHSKCAGNMPDTPGTIDFGCTGVPLSPPFSMAVRLDNRSWEETLNASDTDFPDGSALFYFLFSISSA